MTTDWSNPLNVLDFVLKITTLVFATYYLILTLRLNRQKPTKTKKLLIMVFTCLVSIAALYVSDILIPIKVFDLIFAFVIFFMSVLNIGLLYFATEIYASERYEKSIRSKFVNGGYAAALLVTSVIAAMFSSTLWFDPPNKAEIEFYFDITQIVYVILSVLLTFYLISNSYRLALRIAKTDESLKKYRQGVLHIGNLSVMIFCVYVFLAIESVQEEFSIYGRLIWVFMIAAMGFVYLGFIKPNKKARQEKK